MKLTIYIFILSLFSNIILGNIFPNHIEGRNQCEPIYFHNIVKILDHNIYSKVSSFSQVNDSECWIIQYQLWDNNGTVSNPQDDILIGSYTTVLGSECAGELSTNPPNIYFDKKEVTSIDFIISPNPTNRLEFNITSDQMEVIEKIEVYTFKGELIFQTHAINNIRNYIDLTKSERTVLPGSYIVLVSNDKGESKAKVIQITK